MRHIASFARLAVFALVSVGPGAFAETMTTGNLTFEKPGSDWQMQVAKAGVTFQKLTTKDGGRKGGAIIAVGTIASPAASFDSAVATLADSIDQMKGQKYLSEKKGVTTDGKPTHFILKCCSGKDDTSMSMAVVAFQDKDTIDYAELLTLNTEREESHAYEAVFDKMVASFAFDGGGPRPALPPTPSPGSETLNGLFLNTSTSVTPNAFGGTDFRVNMDTFFFDPSGVFADQPPAGASAISGFCGGKPTACGTYQVNGGTIILNKVSERFGIVTTESQTIAHDGGILKIDNRGFRAVEPAHDLKLSGSWTYFWASSGSTPTSSGSVATSRTIVFSPDGRFKRSGFTGVSVSNSGGDTNTGVTSGNPHPDQAGSYTIDGYTLKLTIDGGTSETDSIYLPDKADTGLLVINGSNYLNDKK